MTAVLPKFLVHLCAVLVAAGGMRSFVGRWYKMRLTRLLLPFLNLQELYVTSTKRQKMQISRSIVEAVRSMDPPGRFLEKEPETGLYNDIGDKKATEKTSQALRDGAATLRKQLSEDLGDPDFLSAVFDAEPPAAATISGGIKDKTKGKEKKVRTCMVDRNQTIILLR